MKKLCVDLLILLALMFVLITGLTACSTTTKTYEKKFCNQFIVVEKQRNLNDRLYIVYDVDTKVMYYIYDDGYASGMSPIYNADGSVKVYDGH